ncbi:N-acyl-phosphatidylethanolamine-hydrolyzing phospholipase D [Hymenopellis radicata]|nr:N-acyl-phosphatidylethanolamine-hydrolyzing phospholipase D [Hymenopellis radicata]
MTDRSMGDIQVLPHPDERREGEGKPDHWVDAEGTTFWNPWPSWREHDAWDKFTITFQYLANYPGVPKDLAKELPVRKPSWGLPPASDGGNMQIKATWLGHACFLVELPSSECLSRGARVLFDPVFSNRCSPTQWAGPKRITPQPCTVEELPEIDIVVISHNHYDHLDTGTIRQLMRRTRMPHFFAPLGNGPYFHSLGISSSHIHLLDWWQSCSVEISTNQNQARALKFAITCTPSQHYTGRGISDRRKSLWSSWVLHASSESATKVFFAGDTGYRAVLEGQNINEVPTCPVFKEIGDHFNGFDFAMIPIGAYLPQRYTSPNHCCPADSVLLFKDLRAKRALGMHWGTFILTNEQVLEPPHLLAEECRKNDIEDGRFTVCDIGETVMI